MKINGLTELFVLINEKDRKAPKFSINNSYTRPSISIAVLSYSTITIPTLKLGLQVYSEKTQHIQINFVNPSNPIQSNSIDRSVNGGEKKKDRGKKMQKEDRHIAVFNGFS